MISIIPIPAFSDNYIWTLVDSNHQNAILVDPGDAKPALSYLNQKKLKLLAILITHHHWDHTNGVEEVLKMFNVPVFASKKEKTAHATDLVEQGNEVSINNFPLKFSVMDIPGHTKGHIAYYTPGILFCGDTLFAAGCGRLLEGSAQELYQSLSKLSSLPLDTKVYCAHEYTLANLRFAKTVEPHNPKIIEKIKLITKLRDNSEASLPSTLKEEKATNPFLRCAQPEIIKNVEAFSGKRLSNSLEVFTYLRQWKDSFRG